MKQWFFNVMRRIFRRRILAKTVLFGVKFSEAIKDRRG